MRIKDNSIFKQWEISINSNTYTFVLIYASEWIWDIRERSSDTFQNVSKYCREVTAYELLLTENINLIRREITNILYMRTCNIDLRP